VVYVESKRVGFFGVGVKRGVNGFRCNVNGKKACEDLERASADWEGWFHGFYGYFLIRFFFNSALLLSIISVSLIFPLIGVNDPWVLPEGGGRAGSGFFTPC